MDFEVAGSGLGFPEGPVVMEDGSVILVEIQKGCISRVWNGKHETIATPGGGPNGLAIGPDGALYCCNNGGFEYHNVGGLMVPRNCPLDYSGGRIRRIHLRLAAMVSEQRHTQQGPDGSDMAQRQPGGRPRRRPRLRSAAHQHPAAEVQHHHHHHRHLAGLV